MKFRKKVKFRVIGGYLTHITVLFILRPIIIDVEVTVWFHVRGELASQTSRGGCAGFEFGFETRNLKHAPRT